VDGGPLSGNHDGREPLTVRATRLD
jgi:hypothetical protein